MTTWIERRILCFVAYPHPILSASPCDQRRDLKVYRGPFVLSNNRIIISSQFDSDPTTGTLFWKRARGGRTQGEEGATLHGERERPTREVKAYTRAGIKKADR